jgi:hypothetical protein
MTNLSSPRTIEPHVPAASTETAERVTLGGRVHSHLRELLMSGELAPGQKMSLRSVAETLGVSMMPWPIGRSRCCPTGPSGCRR